MAQRGGIAGGGRRWRSRCRGVAGVVIAQLCFLRECLKDVERERDGVREWRWRSRCGGGAEGGDVQRETMLGVVFV